MIETSTTFLIHKVKTDVQYSERTEVLDTDDLLLYNSLCMALDSIQFNPKSETISSILNYSQTLR